MYYVVRKDRTTCGMKTAESLWRRSSISERVAYLLALYEPRSAAEEVARRPWHSLPWRVRDALGSALQDGYREHETTEKAESRNASHE